MVFHVEHAPVTSSWVRLYEEITTMWVIFRLLQEATVFWYHKMSGYNTDQAQEGTVERTEWGPSKGWVRSSASQLFHLSKTEASLPHHLYNAVVWFVLSSLVRFRKLTIFQDRGPYMWTALINANWFIKLKFAFFPTAPLEITQVSSLWHMKDFQKDHPKVFIPPTPVQTRLLSCFILCVSWLYKVLPYL